MMYSFSHLSRGDTCLRVFSTYDHDIDQPGYVVRVLITKNGHRHFLPEHAPFKSINAAEAYHFYFVLGCKDKGFKVCDSPH